MFLKSHLFPSKLDIGRFKNRSTQLNTRNILYVHSSMSVYTYACIECNPSDPAFYRRKFPEIDIGQTFFFIYTGYAIVLEACITRNVLFMRSDKNVYTQLWGSERRTAWDARKRKSTINNMFLYIVYTLLLRGRPRERNVLFFLLFLYRFIYANMQYVYVCIY